jgi:hypothetical protein
MLIVKHCAFVITTYHLPVKRPVERNLSLPRAELHHIKPTYRPINVHLAIAQITSPGRLYGVFYVVRVEAIPLEIFQGAHRSAICTRHSTFRTYTII